jgi:hypothetical protein
MPIYLEKSGKTKYVPARPKQPLNQIEMNREFICFDGRCSCGGLIFVFKIKTLRWDLVDEEGREMARKRAELGVSLERILEEDAWIGVDEQLLGECEKCGRTHYFWNPELYPPVRASR